MESSVGFVHEIGAENGIHVRASKVRLTFVKSGRMLGFYISAIRDMNQERRLIKIRDAFPRELQRVFATGIFGMPGEKQNSFVIFNSSGDEANGLRLGKVLLLFRMNV